LSQAYADSDGSIQAMLRVLFNADWFKSARFQHFKSPTELVASIMRLVGSHRFPEPGLHDLAAAATAMGQYLHNPPTVEGWHTGKEWIDGGTLTERVNFAVNAVADASKPGIRDLIERVKARGHALAPDIFVDTCLDLLGPLEVGDETHQALHRYARAGGELRFGSAAEDEVSTARIRRMLQLIVATQEYQFA
jgi:hypothetical protein